MEIKTYIYGKKCIPDYLYIWMESREYLNLIKILGNERIIIKYSLDNSNYELDNHHKWENFIILKFKETIELDKKANLVYLNGDYNYLFFYIDEIKR